MRKLLLFIFILSHCCIWSQNQKTSVLIPGQYIVVLKESFAAPVVRSGLTSNRAANKPKKELRQQNNAKLKSLQLRQRINESAILFDYADVIVGFNAKLSEAEVRALRNDPAVEGVYQDRTIQLNYTVESESTGYLPEQTEDCAISTLGGHADGSSKYTLKTTTLFNTAFCLYQFYSQKT